MSLHCMTSMGVQVRLQAPRARGGAHAGGGGRRRGAHAGLHQPRAAPGPVRPPPATNPPFAHGKARRAVSPMRRLAFISFSHDLMLGRAGTLTARAPKGPSGCIMPAPCAHASSSEQRLCWHAAARAVHGEAHPAPGPAPLASGRSSWLALSRPGPRTGGARSCGSGSALPASASAAGQSRRRRRRPARPPRPRCRTRARRQRRSPRRRQLSRAPGMARRAPAGQPRWSWTGS